MNFFCTKKHYEEWVAKMQVSQKHFCLTAAEALQVAQMLFSR
ncbi:MAG: alkylmercury lyase family protein [Proteobacteria bacterium]|nr:alkylmercury lyase family protein [Pseudomonadota bacterium]